MKQLLVDKDFTINSHKELIAQLQTYIQKQDTMISNLKATIEGLKKLLADNDISFQDVVRNVTKV